MNFFFGHTATCYKMRCRLLYVDLTVINSFCKSHSHKDSEALYKEKEKLKETRYLKHVEARGGSFVTFSVQVNGVLSRSAKLLVNKIEKYVDKVGELKTKILTQLHRCNAQILLNAACVLN